MENSFGTPKTDSEEQKERLNCLETSLWRIRGTIKGKLMVLLFRSLYISCDLLGLAMRLLCHGPTLLHGTEGVAEPVAW